MVSSISQRVAVLLRQGLLDELHLLLHPIVVGRGKRLFDDGTQVPLRLTDSKTFGTGVLHLTIRAGAVLNDDGTRVLIRPAEPP